MKSWRWILGLLALGAVLFLALPARVLECDAVIYASAALQHSLWHATYPGHLAFGPLELAVAELGRLLTPAVHPLFLLRYLSLAAGLAGALIFFSLLRRLGTAPHRAAVLTAVLLFSYAYWHFSLQAESHILMICGALLFLRSAYGLLQEPTVRRAAAAGALLGLATLMHQSAILLVLPLLVALGLALRRRRSAASGSRSWWALAACGASLFLLAVLPFLLVGTLVLELDTPAEFRRWLLGISQRGPWGHWQARTLPATLIGMLRSLIGSHYLLGFADVRALAVRLFPHASWQDEFALGARVPDLVRGILLLLHAAWIVLLPFALVSFLRRLKQVARAQSPWALLLSGWVLVFLIFSAWWAPERAEFWIALLPPVLVLFAHPGRHSETRRAPRLLTFFALALLLVNLLGSIYPQSRPELEPETLAALAVEAVVEPGDWVLTDIDPQGRATRFVGGLRLLSPRALETAAGHAAAEGRSGAEVDSLAAGIQIPPEVDSLAAAARIRAEVDSLAAAAAAAGARLYLLAPPISPAPLRRAAQQEVIDALGERLRAEQRVAVRAPVELHLITTKP